ncbi:MAG: hypothetical protein C0490_04890 [Marivirga sp.]|nr:hypothetical protein [Marivirga sp.]
MYFYSGEVSTAMLKSVEARCFYSHPEILYDKALRSLECIFGCQAIELQSQIEHWHIANWVEDHLFPWCLFLCYPGIQGGLKVSDPVDNTLYFAGEVMLEGTAMGTVEAALVNGSEVAEGIDKG